MKLLLSREMTPTIPDRQNKRPQGEDAREILIEIDAGSDTAYTGRLRFCYLNKTLYFQDLGTMLMQLDQVMDEAGLPERAFAKRTGACFFPPKIRTPQMNGDETEGEMPDAADACAPHIPSGRTCLFQVHVYRRDHCSMQGTIHWARQKTQQAAFRSGMELIRLIRDAVSYQRYALQANQRLI